MDDNSGNTTDKRNWRERLGIGKTAGTSDMPKISGDFKPVTVEPDKPVQPVQEGAKSTASGPVRAAPMAPRSTPTTAPRANPAMAPRTNPPMAPRANPKPIASGAAPAKPATPVAVARPAATPSQAAPVRNPAPRTPPLATDALANKLKDQREAAERLALQRVQAAKQKAEATLNAGGATAKPKFSFADDSGQANSTQSVTTQPAVATPVPRPAAQPTFTAPANTFAAQPAPAQLQPPRPQLGGGGFGVPPNFQQQAHGYAPTGLNAQPPLPQNYGYQQPPSYRPIDPNTGYAPAPSQGYVPAGSRQPFQPSLQQMPQRMPVPPQRGPMPPLSDARVPIAPRGPQVALGSALGRTGDADDVFEPAPVRAMPKRATANEYQQAYRDELGYEDELPRSRGLGTLLALLMLALVVAFGAVYGYANYFKNQRSAAANGTVPVVAAPATPVKTVPDNSAANGQADQVGKKQIYDRIEGDHEVPGGPLKSSEEAPAIQPGAAQPGKAVAPDAKPASGAEGTPLPLPPPPGSTGQQGSLSPDSKTDVANITPAAEQSSAANLSVPPANQTATVTQAVAAKAAEQLPLPLPDPVAATQSPTANADSKNLADAPKAGTETIQAVKPAASKPTPLASSATDATQPSEKPKKADALKKLVLGKSLGAKPVVLVAPGKAGTAVSTTRVATAAPAPISATGGNSLYGDAPLAVASTPALTKPAAPALALAPAKPDATLAATPSTTASIGSAYVVQLATFNSKAEASAAYQRLSAKHGAIVTRYAPIIAQADIAGSTRYKLNLGPIPSNEAASSVCSALISAGERDCVVRRQ